MYSLRDISFKHPSNTLVAGPTGSGKTCLVREIVADHGRLFSNLDGEFNVLWAYGQWQELYTQEISGVNIEYFKGLPSLESIEDTRPTLIVIDDLMSDLERQLCS